MTDSSTAVRAPRRADESMSLLVDIATQALDPGYAEAARQRPTEPGHEPSRTNGPCSSAREARRTGPWLVVGTVLAATLLIVVAAVQAHERAPVAARTRETLLQQVTHRNDAIGALQERLDRLRSQTTALRDAALASSRAGERLAGRLATEELAVGTVPVSGPGLRVTLDDAHGADSGNRVLDRDLQAVVNALWAAGAEAVAINGQRMTAQSAIRQAGDAVLVNFQPVSPPYTVSAVGDPVAMETTFGASHTAARERAYAQLYGLRFHYAREDSLTLPPAPGLTLRYAAKAPRTPGAR